MKDLDIYISINKMIDNIDYIKLKERINRISDNN